MPYVAGPFDSIHYYLQWGGKLPGDEEWSCGMRLRATTGIANNAAALDSMAGVVTAVTAFHARATTFIYALALLSWVKLNVIDTDGTYVEQTTNETAVADTGGGVSGVAYPNQVALVATLETGFSAGPAHRGRFYIPLPAMAVESNGRIAEADAAGVAASIDTLIEDVNTASIVGQVAVFSRKSGVAGHRTVTHSRVGRVLDTQRRRRRSLLEGYALAT